MCTVVYLNNAIHRVVGKWRSLVVSAVFVLLLWFSYSALLTSSFNAAVKALRARDLTQFDAVVVKGWKPNYKNGYTGRAIGHYLIIERCYEDIDFFKKAVGVYIQNGGDINKQDVYGKTPLHYAYLKKVPDEIIRFMIQSGADPTAKDKAGCPADQAGKSGQN